MEGVSAENGPPGAGESASLPSVHLMPFDSISNSSSDTAVSSFFCKNIYVGIDSSTITLDISYFHQNKIFQCQRFAIEHKQQDGNKNFDNPLM